MKLFKISQEVIEEKISMDLSSDIRNQTSYYEQEEKN